MPRPLVAVFQEFASLSFTPADADLNTCIAGVAKQVKDYDPENPADTLVDVAFARTGFSTPPPGMVTGAVLETAAVTVLNPTALVGDFAEAVALTLNTRLNTITMNSTNGISVGDAVVVNGVAAGTVLAASGGTYSVDPTYTWSGKKDSNVSIGGLSRGVIKSVVETKNTAGDVIGISITVSDPKAIAVGANTGVRVNDVVYGKVKHKDDTTDQAVIRKLGTITSLTASSVTISEELTTYKLETGSAIPEFSVVRPLKGAFDLASSSVETSAAPASVSIKNAPVLTTGEKVAFAEKVYVGFVARRQDLNRFQDVKSSADIASAVGKVDPRNPLAMALWAALTNTGTKVVAYGVKSDSAASFAEFEKAVAPRSDVYCVVPVSLDPDVQLAVVQGLKAKFNTMADPQNALKKGVAQRFKMVAASGFSIKNPKIVASATDVTSFEDAGLFVLSSQGAKFIDAGVRVTDRIVSGNTTGTVIKVVSNQSLLCDVSVTGSFDVERDLDTLDKIAELSAVPTSMNSKRVVMVLGDQVAMPAVTQQLQPAAYLGAAVGGMIAGLPPHSGITNLTLSGITDIKGTQTEFDEEQLTQLSDAGWCVFVEDVPSAAPYCIHGVTTSAAGTVEETEIMSVKNFDYVAAVLGNQLNSFIGTWNLNEETFGFINSAISGSLESLKNRRVPKLGAPVIDSAITSLGQSTESADRAEVFVELRMPKSLNTIGLHLVSV